MSQVWPTSWCGMSGPGSHGSNLDVNRPSPGILCVSYPCHSMACLDRQGLEFGDKIIMPEAAFNKAHSLRLRLPLLFKVVNAKKGMDTNGSAPYLFCGVLEFSAPRDQVFMPYWMMQKLLLTEGERVELRSIGRPPPGSFVRFRPEDDEFLVLAAQQGPKALMEGALRHYSVLSEGISILVQHEGTNFHLEVVEIKTQAASIPPEEIDHGSIGRDGDQRSRRENSKRLVRSESRVGYDQYDQNIDGYSSSTVNGGRRVSLVSLLGDIDLEVEFCPRGVDSSEVEGLRREATGALVQEHQALTSSSVSGCAADFTEGMKRGELLTSELALPPPASATKITDCSNGSGRTRVPGGRLPTVTPFLPLGGSLRSGPGKDVSSSAVSKRRSSRCRAFSGKGVALGSTTCEVDRETAAGRDQGSLDHQPGLREDGTSIAVAGDEPTRLDGDEAALDTGRNESLVTASRGNLKAGGNRKHLRCIARPDKSASPKMTKAAARNLEGAEQAAIFNLNSETDVYVCQRCGRCVPTANRTLHELRCFTVSGTKYLHPPSSSLRLQETWPMCPEKTKRLVTPGTEGKQKVGKTTPEDCSSSRQAEDLLDDGKRDSITSCRADGFLGNGVQTLGTACVSGAALDHCSVEAPEKKEVSEECSLVAASGKSTPSKSKQNGEVVPGHGVEGVIFPPQHGGHQNATVSTHQPTCSFCGLSFRMPGAAAAHEMLCGARTERCPTCGGYVPRSEMESHRKPGGSCDAMIAAAMAAKEEEEAAFFFSDSNVAACVDYGSGGGLYGMPKLNASPADPECSSKATSIRDRRDISVLGAQCTQHQRRGIPSALGGGGGGRKEGGGMPDSIPMATSAIRAAGQSFVDADAATDGGTTTTTLESEGGGFDRNHGHPARQHIPGGSFDETEAMTKDEGATIGVSTMARIESLDGHFSGETPILVNGGSRPTGSEVKVIREEVDATFQDGRNGHRCTRSGGVPVLPSRAPAAGDAAAFVEEQIIGVDNRNGAGVPGTGAVMGMAKDSWACSQCTLLNSLYADACDACGVVKTNPRDVDAEGAVALKTPRETRRCDAPTTEAPGRKPNGQPSGTFVHSEAPLKRSIAGACGVLHSQHVNHGPRIGEFHQLQQRGVVVATEEKRLFQQGRDGNRRQGQPISINTFRSTTAVLKTGRWGLGGNHRPSTLRHLPPVIRPRHMTDSGTPLLLPNDANVGIASVSADLSDVTVSSRFPYLKSSGTREESWTGRRQQKKKQQQPNASNIPKEPCHISSRARSSCGPTKNSKGSGRALTTAPAAAGSKTTACDQLLSIVGNSQVISSGAFVGNASRQGAGRSQPKKPAETSSPLARDFPNSGLRTEGLEVQQRGRGHTGLALAKLRRRRVSHAGMVLEPLGSK